MYLTLFFISLIADSVIDVSTGKNDLDGLIMQLTKMGHTKDEAEIALIASSNDVYEADRILSEQSKGE